MKLLLFTVLLFVNESAGLLEPDDEPQLKREEEQGFWEVEDNTQEAKDIRSYSEAEQINKEVPNKFDQAIEQQDIAIGIISDDSHDDNDDINVSSISNKLEAEWKAEEKIMKWTPEELKEGDRLCAEALKLSEGNAYVELQTKKEFDLFKQASELGNGTAIGIVAYAQLFGVQTDQNIPEALEKFIVLAKEGNSMGKKGLEMMSALGIGVDSNQADRAQEYWKSQLHLVDKGKHQASKTYYA